MLGPAGQFPTDPDYQCKMKIKYSSNTAGLEFNSSVDVIF